MPKACSLLNNVYFDQKLVSLYSNIRLLGRDEWGKPPLRASIVLRIFSIKTTKSRKAKQRITELPRCVKKGLVACRDTVWEFFCEDGTSKSNKQHIRASNR